MAIESLQLLTLLLPPDHRRKLHLLLRFMAKVTANTQLVLDKEIPMKTLVILRSKWIFVYLPDFYDCVLRNLSLISESVVTNLICNQSFNQIQMEIDCDCSCRWSILFTDALFVHPMRLTMMNCWLCASWLSWWKTPRQSWLCHTDFVLKCGTLWSRSSAKKYSLTLVLRIILFFQLFYFSVFISSFSISQLGIKLLISDVASRNGTSLCWFNSLIFIWTYSSFSLSSLLAPNSVLNRLEKFLVVAIVSLGSI